MNRALTMLLAFGLLATQVCFCQAPTTGTPPFGSFGGGPFDTINLGNLNVHFVVPVLNKAGRGMPFAYNFSYDGSVWYPVGTVGSQSWTPVFNWGWIAQTAVHTGYVSYTTQQENCDTQGENYWIYSGFVYIDPWGTSHPFVGTMIYDPTDCINNGLTTLQASSTDGSFLTLSTSVGTHGGVNQSTITTRKGTVLKPPFGSSASTATDANGNQISVSTSGAYTDTLGTTALTVSGTAPSPTKFVYTAPTGSAQYTMNYKQYTVQTSFGCGNISEYGPISNYLVDNITAPDGSKYQFTYETNGSNVTGRIASVQLPTGGTITYSYTGANKGIECSDGSAAGLSRTTPDSATAWTYSRSLSGTTWVTTVVDPQLNKTVINFAKDSAVGVPTNNFYELQRLVYQGASTLLLTTSHCWNNNLTGCATHSVSSPITQVDAYRLWPSGSQSHSQTLYDSVSGLETADTEYDYGGTKLRYSAMTYSNLGAIGYRPACVQVTAGTVPSSCGTITTDTVSATTYSNYDSAGNVKTISRWVSGSKWLSTGFTYTTGGLVQTVTDVNGALTTYTYAANNNCPANSFPSSVAEPLSLSASMTWDCNGGVPATAKDENQQQTTFSYDLMWRMNDVQYPDGGEIKTAYNITANPPNITANQLLDSAGHWLATQANLDGLGRVSQTQLTSDPSGVDYVDTSYDALGRVYSVSNPHRSTSSPTDGTTYYSYDALGRTTRITNPDPGSTYRTNSYTNRATKFTDEAGIQKVYQTDGLGRLVNVCYGVGAGTQANGATPSACGLDIPANGFLATYNYGALSNLTSMTLPGQGRQFTYDGLSRMLTENVPEIPNVSCGGGSHSKCYTYDTVTAGDLSTSTFLNPSGISVNATYSWDALHRLSTLYYSDGSDGFGYSYDASTWLTWNLQNGKGRLTSESHSNGAASAHSYDAMGRPVWEGSCAGANCYTTVRGMRHTYDYAGNVAIMTDSYGTAFTNTRNSIGQLTNVQSSWSDTAHPGTLLSGATYNPLGELSTVTYGDRLPQTNSYDSLGRLTERQVGSSPTYRMFLTYNPNSTISEYQDNVTGRWDYTYDAFNRLATANLTQTGNNSPPHYTYSYDQYGNRWQQHRVSGTGNEVDYTFTAYNKNTNFTYDSMGNVIKDGVCTANPCWSFDYAGHLTAGNGASYLYDALGRRQQKTDAGGTVHSLVVDADGKPFDEYAPGLARVTGGFFDYEANKAEFNYLDQLGTPRLSTDYTGAVVRTEGVLMGPFGDNFTETNTSLDFTGFADGFWDVENNGDHFGAREYQKTHGSWLSPDPAGMAAVDPSNPQSWNRYAYVTNNPVSKADPTGLVTINPSWYMGFGGGGGCSMDGVDTPCNLVQSTVNGGGAVPCPNNQCNGYTAQGTYVRFYAFAGGTSGYFDPSGIAQGVWEWGGHLLTAAGWSQLTQPYSDQMQKTLAGILGVDPSQLTALGLRGGNANFQLDQTLWNSFISGDSTCASGPFGTRCSDYNLHFGTTTQDDSTIYWLHMDSGDPYSLPFGPFQHLIDVIGGYTILQTGVPH